MKLSFVNNLRTELSYNPQIKIKAFILLYRVSKLRQTNQLSNIILLPVHVLYWFYSQILLNIEIPISCEIGQPITIWHGTGVVINPKAVIGPYCIIRNGVTIGNDGKNDECPTLSSNIEIGANAVLVGNITIDRNVKIAPCAFINYDVGADVKVVSLTKMLK